MVATKKYGCFDHSVFTVYGYENEMIGAKKQQFSENVQHSQLSCPCQTIMRISWLKLKQRSQSKEISQIYAFFTEAIFGYNSMTRSNTVTK